MLSQGLAEERDSAIARAANADHHWVGQLGRGMRQWLARSGRARAKPAPSEPTEIYLEDTLTGVTIEFTGKARR